MIYLQYKKNPKDESVQKSIFLDFQLIPLVFLGNREHGGPSTTDSCWDFKGKPMKSAENSKISISGHFRP